MKYTLVKDSEIDDFKKSLYYKYFVDKVFEIDMILDTFCVYYCKDQINGNSMSVMLPYENIGRHGIVKNKITLSALLDFTPELNCYGESYKNYNEIKRSKE